MILIYGIYNTLQICKPGTARMPNFIIKILMIWIKLNTEMQGDVPIQNLRITTKSDIMRILNSFV
jgi:hypothetical protein